MLFAGWIGQVTIMSSLASDVGGRRPSCGNDCRYSCVLSSVRAAPVARECGKWLIKSPKLDFADVGLAAVLLTFRALIKSVVAHWGEIFANICRDR